MDQDCPVDGMDAEVPAFAGLRAEISLLRRAVERLTDERTMQVDYGPSLEAIARGLEDVCVWARRVSERPALQLTPQRMASELAEAAMLGREQDQHLLEEAAAGMKAATARADARSHARHRHGGLGRNMMVKAHPQDRRRVTATGVAQPRSDGR
jgi:hypothetical protein